MTTPKTTPEKPTSDERLGLPSASSMEANSLCVGRHVAQQSVPAKPKTKKAAAYASGGTSVHKCLSLYFLGKEEEFKKAFAKLDSAQKETFESSKNIAENTLELWAQGSDYTLIVEERMWAPKRGKDGKFSFSGQPDLVARAEIEGFYREMILDFKSLYGDHAVAPSNLQLRTLVALRWLRHPNEIVGISVGLVQPNVSKTVDLCYYDPEAMNMAVSQVWGISIDSIKGGKRTAGEKQCQYCTFKDDCDKYAKFVKKYAPAVVRELPVSVRWTPEQWRTFLSRQKEMRQWIAARLEEATAMFQENPEAIPDFQLTPKGKVSTKITSLPKAFEQLCDTISRDAFFECCDGSVTKLSKAVAEVTKCSEAKASKFVEDRLAGIIEKTEGERFIQPIKS